MPDTNEKPLYRDETDKMHGQIAQNAENGRQRDYTEAKIVIGCLVATALIDLFAPQIATPETKQTIRNILIPSLLLFGAYKFLTAGRD